MRASEELIEGGEEQEEGGRRRGEWPQKSMDTEKSLRVPKESGPTTEEDGPLDQMGRHSCFYINLYSFCM